MHCLKANAKGIGSRNSDRRTAEILIRIAITNR